MKKSHTKKIESDSEKSEDEDGLRNIPDTFHPQRIAVQFALPLMRVKTKFYKDLATNDTKIQFNAIGINISKFKMTPDARFQAYRVH